MSLRSSFEWRPILTRGLAVKGRRDGFQERFAQAGF